MALKRERGSNKNKGLCKLAIDGDMTIYAIDDIKKGLSVEMAIYDRFELNLSAIEEIDSAGIQLLIALRTELMQKKKELIITAASDAVMKLMQQYDVSEYFNMEGAS